MKKLFLECPTCGEKITWLMQITLDKGSFFDGYRCKNCNKFVKEKIDLKESKSLRVSLSR